MSKHLETAIIKIYGESIDLVNLRDDDWGSESASTSSKKFGTPEIDAMRRDLTINAMFYNINEGKVEDLTKMGIDDMRQGLARTPLDPMITFTDDPLRIIRTVRFAQRFNLTISDEIKASAKTEESINFF